MKLDVSKLLKKKILSLPFEIQYTGNTLERENFKININPPLTVKGEAILLGSIVNVKGIISLSMKVQCSRCLENFDYEMNIEFYEEFSKIKENEDMYLILDENIDFMDMVIDNIIVSIPLKLLCSKDCKGLCPDCGNNLNKSGCKCIKENLDPRFAVLENLFKDDKEV